MAYGLIMNGKVLAAVNSPSLLANDKEPWADGNRQRYILPRIISRGIRFLSLGRLALSLAARPIRRFTVG